MLFQLNSHQSYHGGYGFSVQYRLRILFLSGAILRSQLRPLPIQANTRDLMRFRSHNLTISISWHRNMGIHWTEKVCKIWNCCTLSVSHDLGTSLSTQYCNQTLLKKIRYNKRQHSAGFAYQLKYWAHCTTRYVSMVTYLVVTSPVA